MVREVLWISEQIAEGYCREGDRANGRTQKQGRAEYLQTQKSSQCNQDIVRAAGRNEKDQRGGRELHHSGP